MPNDGLLSPLPHGGSKGFFMYPRATHEQIGSGDVITTDTTVDGVTTGTPEALGFVFETTPAVTSVSDTTGHPATIIKYPDESGLGSPDHPNNSIKVAAGPNGDVVVTLMFYRPQRPGVEGAEEAPFMDIGHLAYALGLLTPGQNQPESPCEPSEYSNLSPTLSLTAGREGSAGGSTCLLVDSAGDRPATPGSANTLSFTVDLTRWLAAKGLSFPVSTPSSPQPLTFVLVGAVLNSTGSSASVDDAKQLFTLQRTS